MKSVICKEGTSATWLKFASVPLWFQQHGEVPPLHWPLRLRLHCRLATMTNSQVIVLTGASRGLGLAVLRILLEQHTARVVTISRSTPPEFQAVVKANEDRCIHVQGDVAKVEDNVKLAELAVERWGRLDSVIVCAGTMSIGALKVGLIQVTD